MTRRDYAMRPRALVIAFYLASEVPSKVLINLSRRPIMHLSDEGDFLSRRASFDDVPSRQR